MLNSSGNTGSAQTLQRALGRVISLAPRQLSGQFTSFFATTPVNQLSVNSTGQHIPLQQFMGQQLVQPARQHAGIAGAKASRAWRIPCCFLTELPARAARARRQPLIQFGTMASNCWLSTAALQLGSDLLSLFGGDLQRRHAAFQSLLFGTGTNSGTGIGTGTNSGTGTGIGTGIGTGTSSLASALQGLSFGSSDVNSAITNAFNTGFSNLLSPINSFLGLQSQSNSTLPTNGLTSMFGSEFTGSSFNSGFNNGFATGTNSGFVGFGVAPT